jgi:hypothetical protein
MKGKNLIDMEMERRKAKMSGRERFNSFVSRVSKTTTSVSRSVVKGSKAVGSGVVKGVVAADKLHDGLQSWRLRKIKKQERIARAAAKRNKSKSRARKNDNRMTFLPSGKDNPLFKK